MFLVLALLVITIAASRLNWLALGQDPERLQLSVVATLIITSIWMLQTGIHPGLNIHFLALTTLTLCLGWRLSLICATIALVIITVLGINSWSDFGVNLLLGVVWPISFTYFFFLLTYSYMAKQLFIYTFIAGFFNAALTLAVSMLAFGLHAYWTDLYSWRVIMDDYLTILPLVLFPEGLINGMSLTALVMYKPEWVCTYSDHDYLFKKK